MKMEILVECRRQEGDPAQVLLLLFAVRNDRPCFVLPTGTVEVRGSMRIRA
jgi:hypothetical protein